MHSTLNLPNLPNYNLAPLVAMVANAGPPYRVVCPGDSILLGEADTTGGAVTFTWSGPGITEPGFPQQWVSPSVSSWYFLSVTDSAVGIPCGVTRDSVFVVIANSGHFPIANGGLDTAICPGGVAQLGIATAASYQFTWSHGPVTPQAQATQPGTYTLIVRNPIDTGACLSDTDTVVVRMPLPPAPGFAGQDAVTCAGDTLQLGTPPPAGWTATWTPADGLQDPSFSPVLAWPVSSTEYVLNLQDTSFSMSCAEVSDSVQVFVEQPFTHSPPPPSVRLCPGGCVEIGVPPVAGMRYVWSPTAGLDKPQASLTVARPSVTTVYTLTVTDTLLQSADCRELRFEVVAEVEDCARQTMLQGGVGVLDLGPHAGVTELTVWDAQGRLVYFDADYPSDPSTGSGNVGWQAAGLAKGVYVYRVRRLGFGPSTHSTGSGTAGSGTYDFCDSEWVSKLVVW